jgi:hypothetical protein
MRIKVSGVLLLAVVLAVSGCDSTAIDYSDLELIPVTGKVTLDDKPLVGARVRFIGDDGSGSEGVTDADGNYRLRYDSNKMGAKPGKKKVTITTAAVAAMDDPDAPGEGERIPAKYNSATELTVEVYRGQTMHDFALKSP